MRLRYLVVFTLLPILGAGACDPFWQVEVGAVTPQPASRKCLRAALAARGLALGEGSTGASDSVERIGWVDLAMRRPRTGPFATIERKRDSGLLYLSVFEVGDRTPGVADTLTALMRHINDTCDLGMDSIRVIRSA